MSSGDRDLGLKLRMRRILWAQGFYCPVEVDLSHYEYEQRQLMRQSLTDIDVLGLRFDPDLRAQAVLVDCKSGRESDPARIFWLRGVMDFFHAEQGFFVKRKVHGHARALAPRLGIRVLDEDGLGHLERILRADAAFTAFVDETRYARMEGLWGIDVPEGSKPTAAQVRVKNVAHYLQYLYWMVDEYRNVQSVIEQFGLVARDLQGAGLREKFLAHVGLQRLSLSLLRLAGEVIGRNVRDVPAQVRGYIFGGPLLLREREALFAAVEKIVDAKLGGEALTLEPPYYPELVEVVNKLVQYAPDASQILRIEEAVLLCRVFGHDEPIEGLLGSKPTSDAIVLAKRVALLLQKAANLPETLFAELHAL
ncbi:MAG TPA: hypothetical protein VHE30_11155 [Polyangiaceae bacterium]|nr:hypothetical protein [Polyangiaceae bacterium]